MHLFFYNIRAILVSPTVICLNTPFDLFHFGGMFSKKKKRLFLGEIGDIITIEGY